MKCNKKGLELIKTYEGLKLKAYRCPANILTIGYGHTKNVYENQTITEKDADGFLQQDVENVEKELDTLNLQNLNNNQYSALVSFIYNLGIANFKKSTLLKKIKANPNDVTISTEFKKWVYAGGVKLKGLQKRRTEESALYFKK